MRSLPSVRARLTAWSVGIVALVLIVSGVAVRYLLEGSLMARLDADLTARGRFMAVAFSHYPAPGAWGGSRGWTGRAGAGVRRGVPSRPMGYYFLPRTIDLNGHAEYYDDTVGAWDVPAFRRSLRGEAVHASTGAYGQPIRVYSLPALRNGEIQAVIQVVEPLTATRAAISQLTNTLVLLIPVALLLAAVGGAFLTGRALRPVGEIARTVGAVQAGNLSARLPVRGKDEFAQLSQVLNGMLARLEGAFERQQRFTGNASHELRTPLATIKATASLARIDAWDAEACQAAMGSIERAADRAGRIVSDLLLLACADDDQLVRPVVNLSLGDLLDEALQESVTAMAAVGPRPEIDLELPEDASLEVRGDRSHLTRLFVNLVENAVRHTPSSGRVTVTARAEPAWVRITVSDTGEGIPAEHLPHLCERFYRVDTARSRARGGAGLGLAICLSIVEAHHGEMTIESVVGEGTLVTVCLPRAAT